MTAATATILVVMFLISSLLFRSCLCSGLDRALAPAICPPPMFQLSSRFLPRTTLEPLRKGYAQPVTPVSRAIDNYLNGLEVHANSSRQIRVRVTHSLQQFV